MYKVILTKQQFTEAICNYIGLYGDLFQVPVGNYDMHAEIVSDKEREFKYCEVTLK